LGKAHESATGARKSAALFAVVFKQHTVELFSVGSVLLVEGFLEFPLPEALLLDQLVEQGATASAIDDQRFSVKDAREQEAVETRLFGIVKQRQSAEEVNPLDRKPQELTLPTVVPVKAELVHI
jgi:hypothetical protein